MAEAEVVYEEDSDWFSLYIKGRKITPLITNINEAYVLRGSLDKAIHNYDIAMYKRIHG